MCWAARGALLGIWDRLSQELPCPQDSGILGLLVLGEAPSALKILHQKSAGEL